MDAIRDYDRSTGQTFYKWDVPAPAAAPQPWNRVKERMRKTTTPREQHRGPASLVDICLKVVARHAEELDKVHLQHIPGRLIGRLWEYMKDTGALSVESWKLIASTGLTQDEEAASYICPLLMRHNTWVHKTQPLAAYLEPLFSDSFDFLTHLTITGKVRCDTPELLHLTQLKNLMVFEMIQSPDDEGGVWEGPQLTDSIVREWSRSPDPFPLLRVLRIWGHDYTTIHSLRYVTAFPSLVLYDVAGRERDWPEKSEHPGWESKARTWRRMAYTLIQHSSLLATVLPCDRRILNSGAVINTNFDLKAIQKERELRPFQRGDCKAYERICEDEKYSRDIFDVRISKEIQLPCMCYPQPTNWLECNSLWGFLMSCQISTLTSDRDLLAQGLRLGERAFAQGTMILPPRPMLNLVLGEVPCIRDPKDGRLMPASIPACRHSQSHNGSLHYGLFETQLTLVRTGTGPHPEEARDSAASTAVRSEAVGRPPDASSASTTHKLRKKPVSVSSILDMF
ncbi:hypothetical protein F5Y14DRAFT_322052 [Nemania sp. NC0429]|nr:hypothetical protein F5Y14DRAFT_322052 [Nemania sp. NC0429]